MIVPMCGTQQRQQSVIFIHFLISLVRDIWLSSRHHRHRRAALVEVIRSRLVCDVKLPPTSLSIFAAGRLVNRSRVGRLNLCISFNSQGRVFLLIVLKKCWRPSKVAGVGDKQALVVQGGYAGADSGAAAGGGAGCWSRLLKYFRSAAPKVLGGVDWLNLFD